MSDAVLDRWQVYGGAPATVASGWSFAAVVQPARLWGANGIVYGANGELMVTQVFGSQVTAIDTASGGHRVYSPLGAGINAPDDGVFAADGTFFATEPMNATVSARNPDGTYRTLTDELPAINGITMDRARKRLFADEFRPGGSLWELDPSGERAPRLLLADLTTPNALAVGPDDGLWFPQVVAGEIWRYDLADGTARCVFRDLASPCAVKFDSQGRLVTPESASGAVTRIDIATGARETIAQVHRGIDNIALSPDDRLFISHFVDGRVSEGADRVLSPSGLLGPYGLAVLPDGRIAAADGLSLAVVGHGGAVERTHTLLADLPTLAVGVGVLGGDPIVAGARGQLFRCRIGVPATPFVGHVGDPTGLADSGDGGLLLMDRAGGTVLRVDASGVTGTLATGLTRPFAASAGRDGTVWVACADAVVAVRDGAVQRTIESLGGALGLAAGADGGVVVAHTPSGRVVHVDGASGALTTLVRDAAIGSPVDGATLPHAAAPVVADGDGWLVGCPGDGSIRRLVRQA